MHALPVLPCPTPLQVLLSLGLLPLSVSAARSTGGRRWRRTGRSGVTRAARRRLSVLLHRLQPRRSRDAVNSCSVRGCGARCRRNLSHHQISDAGQFTPRFWDVCVWVIMFVLQSSLSTTTAEEAQPKPAAMFAKGGLFTVSNAIP
ncbi:unnamed protein product [Mesocestoides corti]|uniref:Secreted protein n=1 Tax=Mesocestoides corti TaxID=53468 RepID=A0A0R3U1V1_MESCO|nr:unnamed protein product [Mesocestoides corti]